MSEQSRTPEIHRGPRTQKRGLVSRVVGTFAVVGAVVGLLSVVAGALFNTSEYVTNNVFTLSTIVLDAEPVTAAFSVPSMRPGEEAVEEFSIANTGTGQLRYAITSVTSEDVLASELIFTVREGVTTCDEVDWDATGTVLYQGKLGDTSTVGGWPILGDAATGADSGDRVLVPSASETLCFHVLLPPAATVQQTTTTATFNFLAEQTANN